MKKYELKKGTREFRKSELHEITNNSLIMDYESFELVKSFGTLAEALDALHKHSTSIHDFENHGIPYWCVTQFFVEENEYDENDEWINGGDIHDWTPVKISVSVDDEDLATFDTFKEAETFFNTLDDDSHYEDAESEEGFKEVYANLDVFKRKIIVIKK